MYSMGSMASDLRVAKRHPCSTLPPLCFAQAKRKGAYQPFTWGTAQSALHWSSPVNRSRRESTWKKLLRFRKMPQTEAGSSYRHSIVVRPDCVGLHGRLWTSDMRTRRVMLPSKQGILLEKRANPSRCATCSTIAVDFGLPRVTFNRSNKCWTNSPIYQKSTDLCSISLSQEFIAGW